MTENLNYFGAQSGPKAGPLGPIFSTHLKVLAMSMWCITDVKPVKTFWESDQTPEFDLLWDLKWPRNWAFEAHIVYISESSSNDHIKQDWCESGGKLFDKIFENLNFDSFGSPKWSKNLGLWSLLFTHLQKYPQWACKWSFKWIRLKIFKKIGENLYVDLFWPYLGPKMAWKFGPQGPFFTHIWKYPQYVCKPSFMVLYQKHFEQMAPNLKRILIFCHFAVIKDQNCIPTTFWTILLCTFMPNIGKIRWKLREPIWFEKGWWTNGRTDMRRAGHRRSSADYVSSKVKKCQTRFLKFYVKMQSFC